MEVLNRCRKTDEVRFKEVLKWCIVKLINGGDNYTECRMYQKVEEPRNNVEVKWYHLLLREPQLYEGI